MKINKKTKQSIVLFFHAYGVREFLMLLKYYKLTPSTSKKPMLISTIDGKRHTQGLTDRFNGIISMYALAKATNTPFKIIYTHPFHLTEFLIPNRYNWIPEENELSDSVKDIRIKIIRKRHTLKKLLRLFPLKKQVRVYANINYLDEINTLYHQNYTWGELFDELFKPTKKLEEQITFHTQKIGGKFIACVFRFQSLMGDFKEYNYKPLSKEEQEQLIEKNKNALLQLTEKNNCPVLVTSDSSTFISKIQNMNNVYTIPGRVVHLDCVFDEETDVYMKSFIDFLMISKAEKVYSIGTKIMYQTNFPRYAAKIRNVPFERILIE